jgi:hypothetical protein
MALVTVSTEVIEFFVPRRFEPLQVIENSIMLPISLEMAKELPLAILMKTASQRN